MKSRLRIGGLALLLVTSQVIAIEHAPRTVGTITENNGLRHSWWVIVKTPSILPIIPSDEVDADPQAALQQYDSLLQLSPPPNIRAEAMRRAAELRIELAEAQTPIDVAAVDKAIGIFKQLLTDFPDYSRNDQVLYQLAHAYQLAGSTNDSITSLQRMARSYPNSKLFADAEFRAGELLYRDDRYAEAEPAYHAVLLLGNTNPLFSAAQYKYGWTLYKEGKYQPAIPVFLAIIDRALQDRPASAPPVASIAKSQQELAQQSFHILSLSFAALGGGPAVNNYFSHHAEPVYTQRIYTALGEMLIDKQRYSDAAMAYAAFIARHPGDPAAPTFQSKVIAAYKAGGFIDLMVAEKERYAETYAPESSYWKGNSPTPDVIAALRNNLEELGPYYQSLAQKAPVADAGSRTTDFARAAYWYRRTLNIFPHDPHAASINMALADSLFDGGQIQQAALEYDKTAYDYGTSLKASDAALAAVQSWQQLSREGSADQKPEIQRHLIAESLKLANSFPDQPKLLSVLTQAAVESYELKQYKQAITIAERVLASSQVIPTDLQRTSRGVIADSRFDQGDYAQAESAYTRTLELTAATDPQHQRIIERLATAIYKQGDAARSSGNLRAAADTFLRVDKLTPTASIRQTADYDAAAALISLKDWTSAERVLEQFRQQFPKSELIPNIDKKLAVAYQADNKPALSAQAYQRIAERGSESLETRREALWQSAQLFDQAHMLPDAQQAYAHYVDIFPAPLDREMNARHRLAEIALAQGNNASYLRWLQSLITSDAAAGAARDATSRNLAAQASLELARISVQRAEAIALKQPLRTSLMTKKAAMEQAANDLARTVDYGLAETTTAATYELGALYDNFRQDVLDSQRPAHLSDDEQQQYDLLLEQQAEPFRKQAIATFRANLMHMQQGLWDQWIRMSAARLTYLAPGPYGKHEEGDDHYDSLR